MKKFKELARTLFPDDFEECDEFLRHKLLFIHPEVLKNAGINVQKIVINYMLKLFINVSNNKFDNNVKFEIIIIII